MRNLIRLNSDIVVSLVILFATIGVLWFNVYDAKPCEDDFVLTEEF